MLIQNTALGEVGFLTCILSALQGGHKSRKAVLQSLKTSKWMSVQSPRDRNLLHLWDVFILAEFGKKVLGSVFGQNGCFADFCFWAAGFFRGFCLQILSPHFCGKNTQKNPPGKSPAKSSEICTTKIPDTFLQRSRAKKLRK